jgi:hypothetical protein
MAIDTFTIKTEKLDTSDMFRFEGFDAGSSVFYSLHDSFEDAYITGIENGGALVITTGSAPLPDDFDPDAFIDAEYQAVCGSWDCRAPECKPQGA